MYISVHVFCVSSFWHSSVSNATKDDQGYYDLLCIGCTFGFPILSAFQIQEMNFGIYAIDVSCSETVGCWQWRRRRGPGQDGRQLDRMFFFMASILNIGLRIFVAIF